MARVVCESNLTRRRSIRIRHAKQSQELAGVGTCGQKKKNPESRGTDATQSLGE